MKLCLALMVVLLTMQLKAVELKEGWNLLGSTNNIENINTAYPNAKVVWKYKDNKWYATSPNGTLTDVIASSANIETFHEIEAGSGYWVMMGNIDGNATSGTVTSDDYADTTTDAQTISLNSQVTGNLEVSDDVDYFKFTLSEQTTVEFERQAVNGNTGQSERFLFDVLDDELNQVLDETGDDYGADKDALTLDAGTYYINVRTRSNDITGYEFILNATSGTVSN